jgi:hypothetical protein
LSLPGISKSDKTIIAPEVFSLLNLSKELVKASFKTFHHLTMEFESASCKNVRNMFVSLVKGTLSVKSQAKIVRAYLFLGYFKTKSLIILFATSSLEYDLNHD